MSSKIIFRWDDVSPRVKQDNYYRLIEMFRKHKVPAVLGVIPNVQSKHVMFDEMPIPRFIRELKVLEETGWEVALHGYTHEKRSSDGGVLKLNSSSEFAGLALSEQRRLLTTGMKIMKEWGFNPVTFIAPWHSYDRNTEVGLREEGIKIISDGLGIFAWKSAGLYHIPQILWGPGPLPPVGVVTVALHPNTMADLQYRELDKFLDRVASIAITCEDYHRSVSASYFGYILNSPIGVLAKLMKKIR